MSSMGSVRAARLPLSFALAAVLALSAVVTGAGQSGAAPQLDTSDSGPQSPPSAQPRAGDGDKVGEAAPADTAPNGRDHDEPPAPGGCPYQKGPLDLLI